LVSASVDGHDLTTGKKSELTTGTIAVGVKDDGTLYTTTPMGFSELQKIIKFLASSMANEYGDTSKIPAQNLLSISRLISKEIPKLIKKSKFGKSNYRKKVKTGTGKSKKFVRIGNVVVTRENHRLPESEFTATTKEFTHGWWVRGHWRKCQGLGNNRKGERVVKGFTWILPHTKKDELGLVNKTRVIRN